MSIALAFLHREEDAFIALAKAIELNKDLKEEAKQETIFRKLNDQNRFRNITT